MVTNLIRLSCKSSELEQKLEQSIELVRARKLRDARLELEFVDPATLPTEEELARVNAELTELVKLNG